MCRISANGGKRDELESPSPSHHQSSRMISARECQLMVEVKSMVPRLSTKLKKGDCGRIAVFGGCNLYTGAAYFTAISALKSGSDLVHIFCEKEAGPILRSFSAQMMIHPVLDQEYGMEEIDHWLPKMNCVVIGPGLGRSQSMGGRISIIMEKVKSLQLPVVLDGDGLWHLTISPGMLQGYTHAVITPNAQEFCRLSLAVLQRHLLPTLYPDPVDVADLAKALGHVTVLHKGAHDVFSDGYMTEDCHAVGSPRRCGGQGGMLAGILATFLNWGHGTELGGPRPPCIVASWGACRLARACAEQSFTVMGRSMTTEDLVTEIQAQFRRLYESETFL